MIDVSQNCAKSIYVHVPFDPDLKAYKPRYLSEIMTFPTKKRAKAFATAIGWRAADVVKVASRFCQAWGLKNHPLSETFLANPDFNPDVAKSGLEEECSPERMKRFIDDYHKSLPF